MISPFVQSLLTRTPKLTNSLAHRNFEQAAKQLFKFGDFCVGDTLILVVGPPHVGKTQLLSLFAEYLTKKVYSESGERTPVIGVRAQTSREGRTVPKFVYQELLADLGNPIFSFSKRQEAPNYKPNLRIDESYLLRALTNGVQAQDVKAILIDEGQFLVRAKDEAYKSALVESLKGLIFRETAVVIAGGYELADVVLSYRAHIAATTIVVHLPRYTGAKKDFETWLTILKSYSESKIIALSAPSLLLKNAEKLLIECHGVIGILEKRLMECAMRAACQNGSIGQNEIDATSPFKEAWETIRNDVEAGEIVVRKFKKEKKEKPSKNAKPHLERGRKNSAKPFVRSPKRTHKKIRT